MPTQAWSMAPTAIGSTSLGQTEALRLRLQTKKAADFPERKRRPWNQTSHRLRPDASLRDEQGSGVPRAQAFDDPCKRVRVGTSVGMDSERLESNVFNIECRLKRLSAITRPRLQQNRPIRQPNREHVGEDAVRLSPLIYLTLRGHPGRAESDLSIPNRPFSGRSVRIAPVPGPIPPLLKSLSPDGLFRHHPDIAVLHLVAVPLQVNRTRAGAFALATGRAVG